MDEAHKQKMQAGRERYQQRLHSAKHDLENALRIGLQKVSRFNGIDARKKPAVRYRALYREYITATKGKHMPLVEQLCSLMVQREDLQQRQLNGEPNLEIKLTRTTQQITYLMVRLGLIEGSEPNPVPTFAADHGEPP